MRTVLLGLVALLLAGCCEEEVARAVAVAKAQREEPWVEWSRWGGGIIRTNGGLYNQAPYYHSMGSFPSRLDCESARGVYNAQSWDKKYPGWDLPFCLPAAAVPGATR